MTFRTSISARRPIAMLCGGIFLGLTVGIAGGSSLALRPPITENKGLTLARLGEIPPDLIEEAVGLSGHHLMVRRLTVAPGGQIRKHDHVGRPGLVAVVGGELVDARAQGEITYGADSGAAIIEDENTVHWLFNRGDEPATAILCDLRPPVQAQPSPVIPR